jgi:CRISPR/Cas system-associated exonuclease Cas4 (RecB family)
MPLLTIKDLLEGDPEENNSLIAQARMISSLYEDYLEEQKGDAHLREPGIHASEISGCDRRIVYSLMETARVESTTNEWKKRLKVGKALHSMLQSEFSEMSQASKLSIEFKEEAKISPYLGQPFATKWNIYSSCDGIFTLRNSEGPFAKVGVEIKSASPDSFSKLREPWPEHIVQAHVYMACLDIPMMWFLYWNKGNQNYTPSDNPNFFISYNKKVVDILEARFEKCHVAAMLKELPDKQESTKCEFCPFSHVCQPTILSRSGGFHKPNPRWSK